jgi:hypothetical protein
MSSTLRTLMLASLACVSLPALCADITVPLVFQPQESATSIDVPSLPPSLLDKPVALAVTDARGDSSDRIGQGTDDDDSTFAYRSAQPVGDFVTSVLARLSSGSGIHLDPAAPLQLKLRLTSFSIDESNKPFGSMYAGVVRFAFTVERAGKTLSEGATEGSARRFGQSASAENVAEVLSDATKEAFASVLANPRLQAAWSGVDPVDRDTSSVEAKLERLDALLKAGKISTEEHKRARAEVLKGI